MGINDIKEKLGLSLCHLRLLIVNGMRAKILSLFWKFVDVDMKGDATIRSKGLLDIRLIKWCQKLYWYQ
jgi:hypothetical protein